MMLRMSRGCSGRFIRDWVKKNGSDIGDKMDCFAAQGLLLTHYWVQVKRERERERERRNQSIDFQQNPQS